MNQSPEQILGLSSDATDADATRAFKRLAQKHHPDKPGGNAAKFCELQAALADFLKSKPCAVCDNKGFVTTRQGLGVKKTECPRCWKKP